MSRWDALTSESNKSSTSFRKGGSERRKRTIERREINSQSKHEEDLNSQYVPSVSTLRILRREMSYYKSNAGAAGYRSSVVLDNLQFFEETCRNFPSKQVESSSFLLLVDLLSIEDSGVVQCAGRLMEYLLEERSISFSKEEGFRCITKLSAHHQNGPSSYAMEIPLSLLIRSQAPKFPAEEMAQHIFGPLLLPCLESSTSTPKLFSCMCQTLSGVLQHHNHASAILAPLVEDVSSDGEEKKIMNPLKIRIFSALTICLSTFSNDMSQKKSSACYTLSDAITATMKVDGTFRTTATNTDLDISALKGFFLTSLQSPYDSLFVPSMVLLRSILRRSASESTSSIRSQVFLDLLCNLIFEPCRTSALRRTRCSVCSKRGDEIGQLLSIVHNGQTNPSRLNTNTVNLANDCLADVLQALPWTLWLQRGKGNNRHAISGFRRKIIDFLSNLTTIACCTFHRCNEVSVSSTCNLLKSCFAATQVEDDTLVRLSINLWSTLAKSSITTKSTKVREKLVQLLVESIGGRVTPSGEILPMYTPARIWLLSRSADPFLNELFGSAQSASQSSHYGISLLSSMFRTCPQLVYTDALVRFKSLFCVTEPAKLDLAKLVLLDAFFVGRKNFGISLETKTSTREIALIASANIETALVQGNIQCQCLSLSVFGALLLQDWETLKENKDILPKHFEAVLHLCRSNSAKVRTAACKSIGDFCTNNLPLAARQGTKEGSQVLKIVHLICGCMIVALSDEKALVRSMAMFTLGNLAHSLRTEAQISLEVPLIIDTCTKIQCAMQDPNPKVSGNSIRSSGHWGNLLARTNGGQMTPVAIKVLGGIVDDLSGKISNTLDSLSDGKKGSLTWKQRSAAKKHGWGACHSLGCIFKGITMLDNTHLVVSCTQGVSQTIFCIQRFHASHEKIALSAMAAICDLSMQHLAELGGNSGILGDAITTCINLLHQYDRQSIKVSPKQILETERCLRKLLSAASIQDASVVLRRTDCSESILSFLYTWMVDKNMEGSAFEIFALALQRRGLMCTNVSLEQSFASRSLQQYKKTQLLSVEDLEYDDDGGEL